MIDAHQFLDRPLAVLVAAWGDRVRFVQQGRELRHSFHVLQSGKRLGGVMGHRRPGMTEAVEQGGAILGARALRQGGLGGLADLLAEIKERPLRQQHAGPRIAARIQQLY